MERVIPIHVLEYKFRKLGAFLLVDPKSRKLWFFHYASSMSPVNSMMEEMKGRSKEMVDYLIRRASVKG